MRKYGLFGAVVIDNHIGRATRSPFAHAIVIVAG